MKQLYGKLIDEKKQELYNEQNGLCALCQRELIQYNEANLDHDHQLDGPNAGKVRGLLCKLCNVLEGELKHKFNQSGLVKYGISEYDWFTAHMKYVFNDYQKSDFHIRYLTDKVKQFSKLNLPEQQKIMTENNFEFSDKDKKKDLVLKFKTQFVKNQKRLGIKMISKVTIFGFDEKLYKCVPCVNSKRFCGVKKLPYEFFSILKEQVNSDGTKQNVHDTDVLDKLQKLLKIDGVSNVKMPQIFDQDMVHIGGFEDLKKALKNN